MEPKKVKISAVRRGERVVSLAFLFPGDLFYSEMIDLPSEMEPADARFLIQRLAACGLKAFVSNQKK